MIFESQSLVSRKQQSNTYKSQRGFNLIELLIAIVIGIFISLMIVQYMATSSRVFKRQGADSNLEQNASFAISYLSQFISCLLYTSPSPRDATLSRMPSSA